jgi:hypothetical protein
VAENKAQEFLNLDIVSSFENLLNNLPEEFPTSWNVITLKRQNKLVLEDVSFDEDGKPTLKYSLTVVENLSFIIFANDSNLPLSRVKHITRECKIERHSDILNILAFLNSYADQDLDPSDTIQECIEKLTTVSKTCQDSNEGLCQKLDFIIEQLRLSVRSPQSRRYSSSLVWTSMTWMKTSPGN